MAITIGTRLGSHEITALLGKGGMGEVYRARDMNLKRDVAIKVLPDEFSRDGDRVSRLQREAEVLASLNHPNIASIYDFEEANGTRFLVLELVEGETLADRIQRGPLPLEEALDIARNICDALEAAHDRGIIHRDLKPANVKITPDGKVKVLDFGLAKAIEGSPANATLSNSPTMINSFGATNAGMIIGTAAYMSPEQARGFAADRRSDLFAFGCVLYEMLTGRQAFQGDTISDTLASVLAREPEFGSIADDANPRLLDLLRRCLQKNPKRRWHCAADLRAELDSIAAAPRRSAEVFSPTAKPRPLWRRAIPVAAVAIALSLVTGIAVWKFRPPASLPVTRFSFALPDGQQLQLSSLSNPIGISPDGTQIVYAANKRLYLRSISELDAKPIPGTETQGLGLADPVFSRDGTSILFIDISGPVESSLKKIAVGGGAVPRQL
jgi:serine/threonine protein kinase